jgi:AraC-like DNA-binding protein
MSSCFGVSEGGARSPGLASGQVRSLVAFARHRGVCFNECLSGTGLTARHFCQPDWEVPPEQELRIIRNVLAAVPESPCRLGFAAGLYSDLNVYGLIGQSVLASANIGEALHIISRYTSNALHFVHIRMRHEAPDTRIVYTLKLPVEEPVEQFLIGREMGLSLAVYRLVNSGLPVHVRELGLRFGADACAGLLPDSLSCPLRTGTDENYFLLADEALAIPMLFGDPAVGQLLEEHCYRRMQMPVGRPQMDVAELVQRVNALLAQDHRMDRVQVARQLNMSPRSLSRHLQEAGTCWRAVLARFRVSRACQLLQETDAPLERIAEGAGYSGASALASAFQQHLNQSPARFRASFRRAAIGVDSEGPGARAHVMDSAIRVAAEMW